ncbi:hypothetical protein [Streptomyces sp. RPT161]|uniref:hypothetical protein n=1 Tax=Streptomyces sp. RPT161 TaxID=3015993 RepID=UPI0022B8D45D|nr:hypothetical protein [Streptomyces sp. RPT161]
MGALAAASPAYAADHGPTPYEVVKHGDQIRICTRGTVFRGLVSLGCRAPFHHLGPHTTWHDLRQEDPAVEPMLCKPALANRAVELTEVHALGSGAAFQCTPVPLTWRP